MYKISETFLIFKYFPGVSGRVCSEVARGPEWVPYHTQITAVQTNIQLFNIAFL
jgi:hypothetical protein